MRKLLFILIFIPICCLSQLNISIDILERTDTKKEFNKAFNFSVGRYLYDDVVVGITNEDAVADYIKDGYNPAQDSLIISNFQIFAKYYLEKNLFFIIKSPITNSGKNISIYERIRIGGGVNLDYYNEDNIDIYISYNMLLIQNDNGWRKGELNLGFSSTIPDLMKENNFSKLGDLFYESKIYSSFYNWINKQVTYGYKESVLGY
mgnify:CR=1 FL=1